jgi:LPS-assembly lipoprotein
MSSSDRRAFLALIAALPLAACGFAPAYAPGGPATALRGRIALQEPRNRDAFELVRRLQERLGPATAPRWRLAYTITTDDVGVAITPENAVTRYNIQGKVDWTLTDTTTGTRVDGGRVSSFTSWSATGPTVAGLAAEEDAARRLMVILADQIVTRLIAGAGAWAQ